MDGTSTRPSSGKRPTGLPYRLTGAVDRTVTTVALWGGGAMLLGLMGLTVVDVILRDCFDAPLFGARDAGKLMLLVLVALSVAYSARTGGQVVVEFFSRRMGPRPARWTEGGARIAVIAMLGILCRELWRSGRNAALFGEASAALGIPFGPFYRLLAAGMLLYAAVLVVELLLIARGRMDALGRTLDEPQP